MRDNLGPMAGNEMTACKMPPVKESVNLDEKKQGERKDGNKNEN